MGLKLSSSARKVQDVLTSLGLSLEVVELPASTRTAVEAAQAVGCDVAQIAKSLIFCTKQTQQAVLVITSGANRVNEATVSQFLGEMLCKASADFVQQQTGFTIGGIPPVGHLNKIITFIDEDLLQYDDIWAAAGTPNAVFRLAPADLVQITAGRVIRVT